MDSPEPKYAVYTVLIEDSNKAYENLVQGVDTIDLVARELSYDDAIKTMDRLEIGDLKDA